MSESEAAKVAGRLQKGGAATSSVWDDEALASKVAEVVHATVVETLAGLRVDPPLHELADADQEIAELRRELGAVSFALRAEGADPVRAAELVREAADEALGRLHDVEQQLTVADATVRSMTDLLEREHQNVKNARTACDELLATAYVAREVPWSDVAAGMMTISSQGALFLAEEWIGIGAVRLRGLHDGKVITFDKPVDASKGETVRVLVPYVTPEQAEALVKSELGGRA